MRLDTREKPPEAAKVLFKQLQRSSVKGLERGQVLHDVPRLVGSTSCRSFSVEGHLDHDMWTKALHEYVKLEDDGNELVCDQTVYLSSLNDTAAPVRYAHHDFPDLVVIPQLLPLQVQEVMLSRLLHRDLSNNAHKTNVHFHHELSYPPPGKSFFDLEPESTDGLQPKDLTKQKAMTTAQFLSKRLRWMTLGGQYDWTRKEYPSDQPPPFPHDHHSFLRDLFPETNSQAAIVNLYSPGDTLSLHRDVSEECDQGLISISIGCDGIFMLALQDDVNDDSTVKIIAIQLRSGDAVYMAGPSRYAWHGVPKVLPSTCPLELQDWPAKASILSDVDSVEKRFSKWRGWMAGKRININVRQMWE